MIETTLRTILAAAPALATVKDIAFQQAGQDVGYPLLVLHVVADAIYHTSDPTTDKTHYGIVQVDVIATTYQEARELAEATRTAIDGASDAVGLLKSGDLHDLSTVSPIGADRPESGLTFDVRFIQTEE